jgi:hypothetical protein
MWSVSQVFSQSANGNAGQSAWLKHDLVDVAPGPIFAGLERFYDGVLGGMKVFGGVSIFRRIAAADVAAAQAQAQVDPGVAHLQTFFAAFGVRFYVVDLIEVRTARHGCPLGFDLQ